MSERRLRERNVSAILQPPFRSMAPVVVAWLSLVLHGILPAYAQSTQYQSPQTKSDYDKGYEAGYEAGLRAAAAAQSGSTIRQDPAPGEQPNSSKIGDEPPRTPVTMTASGSSENLNITPRMKSLWAEITTHDDQDEDTFFHHSQTSPFWLSAQANFIAQMHPSFHADYSGPNSFYHAEEQAVSRVVTLFTGFELDDTTEFVMDAESAGWSGLSQALGLGAYVNLDVVRNPTLSAEPYLARLWLRKVIP
jgi:hypothetical protein